MSNKEREIWHDIEAEYTTSDKTLTALAAEFNVSYATLRNKSADNNWGNKRREYLETKVKTEELRRKQSASKEKGAFDDAVIRIAKLSVMKCAIEMTRLTMQDSGGNMIDVQASKKELKENLEIAQKAQEILYRTWDIPSPTQRIDANINRDPAPADALEDEIKLAVEEVYAGVVSGNGHSENEAEIDERD